jgi:chaperonin GroEL
MVAIDRNLDNRMPEMLDNGGVIAKRTVQLPGWREDVGAMFLREVLWSLHNRVGDGTATAAVLLQYIYTAGVRYIASGGNAVRLRAALERGVNVIVEQLGGMVTQISGKARLSQVALTVCHDPAMAEMMGEIFDIIGEYGRLEIRKGHGRELEREYLDGMYWERGLFSGSMVTDRAQGRAELENAAILISDLDITEPQQLLPALELALRAKINALMIVANKLSDNVTGFLLANRKPEKFQLIAVRAPGHGADQATALEDLSVLTGGRPFIKAAGDTFSSIKLTDFGRARRVWADSHTLSVIGGKGDPRALRRHIASLRAAHESSGDAAAREKTLKRIGKLLGGSATLWVGGATELQIEARVEAAKRTAAALRGAIMEGVVPGGGVALLDCRPALQQALDQSTDLDEQAAYRILIDAVAEPLRVIAANAGHDDREIMAQLKLAGPGHGFDVASGRVANMAKAGIFDAAAVQKSAARAGIASAALALTVDVLVHRAGSDTSSRPARSRRPGSTV